MRILAVTLSLPLVFFFSGNGLGAEQPGAAGRLLDAEIVTVGMDQFSGAPIVLLREEEMGRTIPIWIGITEAQAILQALHEIETPRPLTHELTVNLLASLEAQVEQVVVSDMRNGIFYGSIYLRVQGRDDLVEVDCRPSDGLALASRTGARIRVAERVLTEAPDFDFVPPPDVDQVVQVLGMTVVAASEELRRELGLPEREGLVVTAVQEAAERRGFRRGDMIIRVNEVTPSTPMDFLNEVMRTEPGEKTEVHLWREGEEKQIDLPAAEGASGRRLAPI